MQIGHKTPKNPNIPHDSAIGHVSGTSVYIDDMPPAHNEVFVEIVPVQSLLAGSDPSTLARLWQYLALSEHIPIEICTTTNLARSLKTRS